MRGKVFGITGLAFGLTVGALMIDQFCANAATPMKPLRDAGAPRADTSGRAPLDLPESKVGNCRGGCVASTEIGPFVAGRDSKAEPDAGQPPPIDGPRPVVSPSPREPILPIPTPAYGLRSREQRARAASLVSRSPLETEVSHAAIVALGNERGLVCTGALIAPTLILTARHCLPIREVRFGAEPFSPDAAIRVNGAHVPPASTVDVAILQLAEPAPVKPLAMRGAREREPPIGFVRLAGFGATDAGGQRSMSRLHFVDVPVRGWNCDRASEGRTGCLSDVEMVVPRDRGNDTCSGDSGGPLLEAHGDGLRIVAVTSRSVKGALLRCGDGGIYTRTDVIGDWLAQVQRKVMAER